MKTLKSRIRRHTSPLTIVLALVLVLAMGGSSYALVITGANIRNNSIPGWKLRTATVHGAKLTPNSVHGNRISSGTLHGGKIQNFSIGRNKMGRNVLTGGQIKDGSVYGRDIANNTIGNAKIANGTIGPEKLKAAALAPDTLPSGRSMVGAWSLGGTAAGAGELATGAISFPMITSGNPHVYVFGEVGDGNQCPGNVHNPQAKAGNLCIYGIDDNASALEVFNPATGDPFTAGASGQCFGAGLRITSAAAGQFSASGTWAIKAA